MKKVRPPQRLCATATPPYYSHSGEKTFVLLLFHLAELSLHLCGNVLAQSLVHVEWLSGSLLHDVNVATGLSHSLDGVAHFLENRTF